MDSPIVAANLQMKTITTLMLVVVICVSWVLVLYRSSIDRLPALLGVGLVCVYGFSAVVALPSARITCILTLLFLTGGMLLGRIAASESRSAKALVISASLVSLAAIYQSVILHSSRNSAFLHGSDGVTTCALLCCAFPVAARYAFGDKPFAWTAMGVLSTSVIAAALISLSAIGALTAAFVGVIFVTVKGGLGSRWMASTVALVVFSIVAIFMGSHRWHGLPSGPEFALKDREYRLRQSSGVLATNVLTGVGLGQLDEPIPVDGVQPENGVSVNLHIEPRNSLLHFLDEAGLVGLVFLIVVVVSMYPRFLASSLETTGVFVSLVVFSCFETLFGGASFGASAILSFLIVVLLVSAHRHQDLHPSERRGGAEVSTEEVPVRVASLSG